ncbi:MAG: ABC transporter permease [Treponema sp.]|jgi:simple sugar transport system permease protein|nr:ABC transporter permease [Treponema sp.]
MLKKITNYVSLPTLIIGGFWIFLLIIGTFVNLPFPEMFSNGLRRFGRWGILTLAMVPAIQSGVGPNFALPIGIVCGLLGQVCAIVLNFTGMPWFFAAAFFSTIFAVIMGYVYGKLMNAVKGSEMAIATYTGFSITMLFCIIWLVLPFNDLRIAWPLGVGSGLRQTIQLDIVGANQLLDNFMSFSVAGVFIPTGLLIVFFIACFFVWLFMRSKTGIAITAGGANPVFAEAAGLNVDKGRVLANIVSTVLGALGILVYAQSFGYSQLYTDPLLMAFPAVAGILIGGATVRRSRIVHVLLGGLIFQGLMATSLPVANELFEGTDLSETLRMVVQNGVILYALMQAGGGKK